MDIERGNLEILFQKIPYQEITIHELTPNHRHDFETVNKNLYLQYSQSVFACYSENERYNHYLLLKQNMSENKSYKANLFQLIMNMVDRMLTYDGIEMKCKFEQMLRWREISFQLGQDFFTCAYLAKYDLERGRKTNCFTWLPIIRSDNARLHRILERGMAENHFHLAGSTKVFELNWACLMNLIDGRRHDFRKIKKALQCHDQDRIRDVQEREDLYAECQRAALYRVYLFAVLRDDQYLIEKAQKLLGKLNCGFHIQELVAEIQDMIVLAKQKYGAKLDNKNILDYALQTDMIGFNNNERRLLAGERRFLYECYQASLTELFNHEQKNYFYCYLLMRTHFRGELIQVNRQVGFANFANYQDRKEYFIEGERAYEDELFRLAVNETICKENIVSLEARICPKKSVRDLRKEIKRNEELAKKAKEKDAYHKLGYVLHFPKIEDGNYSPAACRNYQVREMAEQRMWKIVMMLEQKSSLNRYIHGIDACANEIGCRPENFAQIFRYLSDLSFHFYNDDKAMITKTLTKGRIHLTYHAGEDFLDLIDGLRAVDETMLFCGLERGSRIGHGLALGVAPDEYYKYKGYFLTLPKQDLIDDIAWMICKADETGCEIERKLRASLEERFFDLYDEIFRSNIDQAFDVSILDYYQSWKLRGDNPKIYRLTEEKFMKKLQRTELEMFDRYALNPKVNHNIRRMKKYRDLYAAYHYNQTVREKGREQTQLKVDQRYADAVYQLQDKMIQQLAMQGIGIETNPSSNYLIGTIHKYEEHPILRFNARKLQPVPTDMTLNVSINTDDQGVFDTLLENEYALMALALKKKKDENYRPVYNIEDIYEWIDYVRKMGLEQVFR